MLCAVAAAKRDGRAGGRDPPGAAEGRPVDLRASRNLAEMSRHLGIQRRNLHVIEGPDVGQWKLAGLRARGLS